MARRFGEYSPAVPLGVTWEEAIVLEDRNGDPIDLSGYAVRAQLREEDTQRNPDTGVGVSDPVFEITSVDYYGTAPAWPLFEGFSIPTPSDGTVLLAIAVADLWTASPTNEKRRLVWDIKLVNPVTGYAIPVVSGRPTFLPVRTI